MGLAVHGGLPVGLLKAMQENKMCRLPAPRLTAFRGSGSLEAVQADEQDIV